MTRTETVKNNQLLFNQIIKTTINNSDLEPNDIQVLGLQLSAIAEQLTEISTSLAMLVDIQKESEGKNDTRT